jgi:CRISPR/Cas system endoribonuclease Cas6 (RAMP superfamily)
MASLYSVKMNDMTLLLCIGICEYHLRGPDEEITLDAPLTVRQQLFLLAHLAFYCGIGYKTSMGMGQARLRE